MLKFTQDVMHTICSPYGKVVRIVIFKKNGLQTMVEYPFLGAGPCVIYGFYCHDAYLW